MRNSGTVWNFSFPQSANRWYNSTGCFAKRRLKIASIFTFISEGIRQSYHSLSPGEQIPLFRADCFRRPFIPFFRQTRISRGCENYAHSLSPANARKAGFRWICKPFKRCLSRQIAKVSQIFETQMNSDCKTLKIQLTKISLINLNSNFEV